MVADRVDLPFVKDGEVEHGRVGWVAPTGHPTVCPPIGPTPYFHDRKVDPFFAGWQVLAEFSATPWRQHTPFRATAPVDTSGSGVINRSGSNPDNHRVAVEFSVGANGEWDGGAAKFHTFRGSASQPERNDWEFDRLLRASVDERPDALGEIIAQDKEFLTYFMDLLSFGPASHPATTKVMHAASLIGLFCVQYWKNRYKRVRPAHLFPGLLPPVATPGHSSFPSGHATQAQLVFRCLLQLLSKVPIGSSAQSPYTIANPAAGRLARRIARNREIAGLHYPSDSAGGRYLADKIFNNILDLAVNPLPGTDPPAMPLYREMVSAATQEWS